MTTNFRDGTLADKVTTMSIKLETCWNELKAIVEADHLYRATSADEIDGVGSQVIVRPGNASEVAHVLNIANSAGLRVAPRGGGTKMSWGNTPRRVDIILSTKRLDQVIEHAWADMTVTVEAGCTVARLQKTLAEHGQHLALDPLWPERATIGGILATNDNGALRLRYGSLRDLIIGITVALPVGTIAKSGGKVVKNVAGYDLPKLMTGALGTLGVITEATFRLYPLAREARTLSFTATTMEAVNNLALAIHDSALAPTSVQIRARGDDSPQLDVRVESSTKEALEAHIAQLLEMAQDTKRIEFISGTWSAREKLWNNAETALVCKFGVLPTQLSQLYDILRRIATPFEIAWQMVVQSIGVGTLRLEAPREESLLKALESLRTELKECGGSLIVLRCPPEMKTRVEVWGTDSDALPLMRRVKEQFDPAGVLNPGRFVGGI